MILYTKAEHRSKNETIDLKTFVDYWKELTGVLTETLVFDCKLITIKVLGELDIDTPCVKFITYRCRNKRLLFDPAQIENSEWQKVRTRFPSIQHQHFLVFEGEVQLKGCVRY